MIAAARDLVAWRLSWRVTSPESYTVTYLWLSLIFNWINHLIICMLGSILNPWGFVGGWWNIHRAFWRLGLLSCFYVFGSAWYLSVHLRSFAGCLGPALILVWHGAMREVFSFVFLGNVNLVLTKFSFWPGDWALGCHSMGFGYFADIS